MAALTAATTSATATSISSAAAMIDPKKRAASTSPMTADAINKACHYGLQTPEPTRTLEEGLLLGISVLRKDDLEAGHSSVNTGKFNTGSWQFERSSQVAASYQLA